MFTRLSMILILIVAVATVNASMLVRYEFSEDGQAVNTGTNGVDGVINGDATVSGGVLNLAGTGFVDSLNPTGGSISELTVGGFYKSTTDAGWDTLLGNGGNLQLGVGYGNVMWDVQSYHAQPLPDLFDGEWHHVVGTYSSSGNIAKCYVDGVEVISYARTGVLGVNSIWVGGDNDWPERGLIGQMDDVRIYDEAISLEEVIAWQVPEPTTMALLGLGAVLLRRKK
jgi:hypothetical protein